jgi:hypothetical protein
MTSLYLIGVAFQVVGITMAAIGMRRTWHEFAPEGQHFMDPITRPLRRLGLHLFDFFSESIHRALRRPGRRDVTAIGAVGFGGAFNAQGRVQFGVLPKDTDTATAIAELDRRTRHLVDQIADTAERVDDGLGRVHGEVEDVSHRLDAAVGRLEEQSKHMATEGIRIEAVGLFFVVVGVLLQGLAGAGSVPSPSG